MKIVTAVTTMDFTPEHRALLEGIGELVNSSVKKLKGDVLVNHIGNADILIAGSSGIEKLDKYVLEQCPNLKMISVLGVGTDYIDVQSATGLGIKVSNLKGANAQSVAEHAWGMILNLSKRITESHIGTEVGGHSFLDYLGIELENKTLGIIGFGKIGSRVAKMAKGFNMGVLSYNRSKKEVEGVSFVGLEQLLKNSDVIVLALPLAEDTKDIIGQKEFDLMKNNVILINPAREQLINKQALFEALKNKNLFGFGVEIDFNTIADPRYYNYPNVLVTPHTGMFTGEAEARSSEMGIQNILKYIEGNPQNLVN